MDDRDVLAPRPSASPRSSGEGKGNAGEFLLYSGLADPELLTRLSDGDPLHMLERAVRRAREAGFLIDGDRLWTRALACVVEAERPEDREQLKCWIDQRIDDAIKELLNEDRLSVASQERPDS